MARKRTRVSTLASGVFDEYRKLFEETYESKSCAKFRGVDRTAISKIITAIGYQEVLKRLRLYFTRPDTWVEQRNHPISIFISRIDQYLDKRGQKNATPKIAARDEAADEIRKFRARRNATADAGATR